jgi:adenylate cyclase
MNNNIIEITTNFLMPAMYLAESSARLAELGAIDVHNREEIELYFQGLITPFPQVQALYYGDKFGNFYMVKKEEDTSLLSKLIYRTGKESSLTLKHRNLFGELIKIEKSKDLNYDPRTRPWYIGAKSVSQQFWTDIYIFFTGKTPGITASYPSYDSEKHFMGVFGVDIKLSQITRLINKQKISKDSLVVIINDKNKVVSFPNQAIELDGDGDTLHPLHISELDNDRVKQAYKKYTEIALQRFTITHNLQKYIVGIKDFPDLFGKKWKIISIVPQKDIYIL